MREQLGKVTDGFARLAFDLSSRLVRLVRRRIHGIRVKRLLARTKSCGRGVRVNGRIRITHPWNVVIGNNVHIGDNAYLNGKGGLVIEDNVHISRNVTVITSSHNYKGEVLPYDTTYIMKPVAIGKNAWIGMNVSIIGAQIGEGAIIGLGATVSSDVPPLAVVANQPPRIIKYRDKEHYHDLEARHKYGGPSGIPLADGRAPPPPEDD